MTVVNVNRFMMITQLVQGIGYFEHLRFFYLYFYGYVMFSHHSTIDIIMEAVKASIQYDSMIKEFIE